MGGEDDVIESCDSVVYWFFVEGEVLFWVFGWVDDLWMYKDVLFVFLEMILGGF